MNKKKDKSRKGGDPKRRTGKKDNKETNTIQKQNDEVFGKEEKRKKS